MVGFKLKNTLSDHGSVSRGVCKSENGYLTDVIERTNIVRQENKIYCDENGSQFQMNGDSTVSMNFWGFTPEFFKQTEEEFEYFIQKNANNLQAEFYIPFVLNSLLKAERAACKVFESRDKWFGVTYKKDKIASEKKIKHLIDMGDYPECLWK
jgi:hypothetical protein